MPTPLRAIRWTTEIRPEACLRRLAVHPFRLAPGSREMSFRLYSCVPHHWTEGRHYFHGALLNRGSGTRIVGRFIPDPFALVAAVALVWIAALGVVAFAMLDTHAARRFITHAPASGQWVLTVGIGAILLAVGTTRWRGWQRQGSALAAAIRDVCTARRDE